MKENKCYQLIQHFGGHDEWENIVAVSHDLSKLQHALKLVNRKGWKVLTAQEAKRPELVTGDYFLIAEVKYL